MFENMSRTLIMNSDVCKTRDEVLSHVKELFDMLYRQMFGEHDDKMVYCPRSKVEAQQVLAVSAEISSCLHSLVSLLPKSVVNEKSEPVAQIVAAPIAYFFFYVDEVLYARFPELVPDGFKESGNYVSSYNPSDAIIKRKDLDELKTLLKNTFERI